MFCSSATAMKYFRCRNSTLHVLGDRACGGLWQYLKGIERFSRWYWTVIIPVGTVRGNPPVFSLQGRLGGGHKSQK